MYCTCFVFGVVWLKFIPNGKIQNEGGNNMRKENTHTEFYTHRQKLQSWSLNKRPWKLWQMLLVWYMVLRLIMDYFENNSMRIFEWCECRLCNLFNGFLANMWNAQWIIADENLCNSINKPMNIRKSWWCKSMCIVVGVCVCD